jgi:hypothetical protein
LRRLAAGQRRFRFLDLCIRFGNIISKVCEGFNSGAKLDVGRKPPRRSAPRRADLPVFSTAFRHLRKPPAPALPQRKKRGIFTTSTSSCAGACLPLIRNRNSTR